MATLYLRKVVLLHASLVLHAHGRADFDEETCPMSWAAPAAVGESLVQTSSVRFLEEDGLNTLESSSLDRSAFLPLLIQQDASVGLARETESQAARLGPWLVQIGESAYARFKAVSNTDKSPPTWLIFVVTLLFVNVIIVFIMILRPAAFGSGNGRGEQALTEEQWADRKGEARGASPTRSFPKMSSPPNPTRTWANSVGTPKYGNEDDPSKLPAGVPSDTQFCPDLVVPQHCECILVLPLNMSQAKSKFEVTDVNGGPILCVVPEPQENGRLWRASITASSGEMLAQCCEVRHQPTGVSTGEFHLLRAGGQYFAKLVHSPLQDSYLLTLLNGGVLRFWGNFEKYTVNITDEANRLFATTEIGPSDFNPHGKYCRLRVDALGDVGLALCGLLCVGQHEMSQRGQSIQGSGQSNVPRTA